MQKRGEAYCKESKTGSGNGLGMRLAVMRFAYQSTDSTDWVLFNWLGHYLPRLWTPTLICHTYGYL